MRLPEAKMVLDFGHPMEVAHLLYSLYFTPSVSREIEGWSACTVGTAKIG